MSEIIEGNSGTESPMNEDALTSLFGNNWRSDNVLDELYKIIVEKRGTPAERSRQIQESKILNKDRIILMYINSGLLGDGTIGLSKSHPMHKMVQHVINTLRKRATDTMNKES